MVGDCEGPTIKSKTPRLSRSTNCVFFAPIQFGTEEEPFPHTKIVWVCGQHFRPSVSDHCREVPLSLSRLRPGRARLLSEETLGGVDSRVPEETELTS